MLIYGPLLFEGLWRGPPPPPPLLRSLQVGNDSSAGLWREKEAWPWVEGL